MDKSGQVAAILSYMEHTRSTQPRGRTVSQTVSLPVRYVVRTPDGYVGRTSIESGTVADLPKALAYVYDDPTFAAVVADAFGGRVEVL